jgi:HTH-type transcriptional repressor of NAD biosynthesis genes
MGDNTMTIKRGFLLGKFMPLHKGHEAMIEFALSNCDELTILVCSLPTESIDGELRFKWMLNRFPDARVFHCDKILPQEPDPNMSYDKDFWTTWVNVIKSYHPEKLDVIFGSEDYVYTLGAHLGCGQMVFDKDRKIVPVSGTMCRTYPLEYWDYMNKEVRQYFVKRVLIIGTESTGKSTLTEMLAKHYNTEFMPEYARYYIDDYLGGNMDNLKYEHFDEFASIHRIIEQTVKLRDANKILFTDTDAITTLIFSREYYGKVSETVVNLANSEKYDLILLCNPDVPWIDDGQRNLGHKREELYQQFVHELTIRNMSYVDIKGNWEERWKTAVNEVDKLMGGL